MPDALTVPPFLLLALAIPVLLLGEVLIKHIRLLRDSNIPAPIIGGLIAAVGLLVVNEAHLARVIFQDKTPAIAWLWPVLPQWSLAAPAPTSIDRPLLILFFTCIGLNASWAVAKKGSWQLLIYLALATAFALIMNTAGVITARLIGEDPLLGVMCSGVSLMGGFGTAAGFAPEFEKHGLHNAATIGVAAAAFGVIAGGIIAGPVAGRLMERKVNPRLGFLTSKADRTDLSEIAAPGTGGYPVAADAGPEQLLDDGGFVDDVVAMVRHWPSVLLHLVVLFACLKLGAFVSTALQARGITFPVYMGSMLLAALARNLHDIAGAKFIHSVRVDLIASFALSWLLSIVMINLKLGELVHSAGPMLILLVVQVTLIAAFAYWVVFRVMGRDYEATAMSAGFIGFAVGATSNAVATMKQLARRYGPAPRAFLIVTVVGAFLIDFTNAFLITAFLNFYQH